MYLRVIEIFHIVDQRAFEPDRRSVVVYQLDLIARNPACTSLEIVKMDGPSPSSLFEPALEVRQCPLFGKLRSPATAQAQLPHIGETHSNDLALRRAHCEHFGTQSAAQVSLRTCREKRSDIGIRKLCRYGKKRPFKRFAGHNSSVRARVAHLLFLLRR